MDILSPLQNTTFRWLFLSQLVSLIGTGLTTVALALFAYELSPTHAGAVLGSALALKMVAYLGVAPVVGGYVSRLPRKQWLAALNIGRTVLVAALLLISEIWQLFAVIFLLNALAAGYTPVYQALLPDVLPEDEEYTKALSLSRLAMEMEALLSPMLAALLLVVASYELLFGLNAAAFALTAGLVLITVIPAGQLSERTGGVWHHVSFGITSYLKTPRLRGVLLLNLALSAAGAMIIVNTVVYVRAVLGLGEQQVPLLMAAAGVGSMIAAVVLPRLLEHWHDRPVMLCGGVLFVVALLFGTLEPGYIALFPIWALIGFATSLVLIPTGRVVRESCNAGDRNDYFSANFALTHGMWLLGYLLAGWLGSWFSMGVTFGLMALVASLACVLAVRVWPKDEKHALWHTHQATDHLHPHVHDEHHQHEHEGWEGPEPHIHPHHHPEVHHRHPFVIDEHHVHWPKQ